MDKFLIHRKIIQFTGMNNPLQTTTIIFFYIRHQLVVKSKSDYGTAILSYGQPKKEGRKKKKEKASINPRIYFIHNRAVYNPNNKPFFK